MNDKDSKILHLQNQLQEDYQNFIESEKQIYEKYDTTAEELLGVKTQLEL